MLMTEQELQIKLHEVFGIEPKRGLVLDTVVYQDLSSPPRRAGKRQYRRWSDDIITGIKQAVG